MIGSDHALSLSLVWAGEERDVTSMAAPPTACLTSLHHVICWCSHLRTVVTAG